MATTEELAALVRALEDTGRDARGRAAQSLLKLRDPRATPLLIAALGSEDSQGTRGMVARILSESWRCQRRRGPD